MRAGGQDQDEQRGSNVRSKHIAVSAGKTYQLDFDAKLDSGSGIAVYLQFFDTQGKKLAISSEQAEILMVIPPKAADWKSYSLQALAPAGSKTLTVWLHSFNQNKVHAYFGNFLLKSVEGISLPNADFEAGNDHWAIRDRMSSVDASAALHGQLGLRVNDQDKQKGSDVRSASVPVVPGLSYQLDFEAQIVSGGGIAVYLQFYDAKGKVLGSASDRTQFLRAIPTSTKESTAFSLAATAPAEARSVIAWVHSFNGSIVQAYFDDFSLKVIPESAVQKHPSEQASNAKPTPKAITLTEFKKKNPAATFADLKILQADGSAFRKPKEDWRGARQRVQQDAEWKHWLEQKQSKVDQWIAHKRDRAGWEAGWNHEFINPDDNSFLVWTDQVPGEEIDHFTSKTGKRVEITPKLQRAWVGAFRKNHASMLIEAANLYHLTEDTNYAEWVAAQLDFYADNYASWGKGEHQQKYSQLGYQSLDDAVIVSRLIDAARLVFDYAGPERQQKWFKQLFKPEAELLSRSYRKIHNIANWQRATQAKIALLYDDAELWEQAVNSKFGLKAQFRYGVTSDYFWYEQSMGYNAFIIMGTDSLFTHAGLLDQREPLQEEAEIAQNMLLSPLSLRFPNKKLPNPSDNTGIPGVSTNWLSHVYRTLPTYLGVTNAKGKYNWDTLIDPPAQILTQATAKPADLPTIISRNMESSRFALLKEGPWQVFFHYGQLTRSHAQAEALNWSASYEDIMISQDVGTVGYGSPLHLNYFRKGLAQNVPLIGGHGQQSHKLGKLLDFDATQASVSAAQPQFRENVEAERELRIEQGSLIDITTIRSKDANNQAPLGLSLHLEGKPELGKAFAELSSGEFTNERPIEFQYWTDLRRADCTGSATFPVRFDGNRTLYLTFKYKGSFTLYTGIAPGQPQSKHQGFYLETTATREATFTTTLSPRNPILTPEKAPKKKRGFWSRVFRIN